MRYILDNHVFEMCSKTEEGLKMLEQCKAITFYSAGVVDDKKHTVVLDKSISPFTTKTLSSLFGELYNSNTLCNVGMDNAYVMVDDRRIDTDPVVIKSLKFLLMLQVNRCHKFSVAVADVFSSIIGQVTNDKKSDFVISCSDKDKFSFYVMTELVNFLSSKSLSIKIVKEVVND